jgi:hypothetical protein
MGRGVIAGLLLETRTDVTTLEEAHPTLAAEFKSLREELDRPNDSYFSTRKESAPELALRTTRLHAAAERFQTLLQEIRSLKGFEHLFMPPSQKDLMGMASAGAIVVFSVHKTRSDAFLITTKDIKYVSLPNLKYSDVEE